MTLTAVPTRNEINYTRDLNVDSSNIYWAVYDDLTGTLALNFRSSTNVYVYNNVPSSLADGLEHADSAGAFYSRWIRGNYESYLAPAGTDLIEVKVPVAEVVPVETVSCITTFTLRGQEYNYKSNASTSDEAFVALQDISESLNEVLTIKKIELIYV